MADPRSNGNGQGRATGLTGRDPESPLHTAPVLHLSEAVLCVCDTMYPEVLRQCPACGSVERIPMTMIVQTIGGRR